MDQGEQEREVDKQDFRLFTNTEKGDLSLDLAEWQVLRSLGFRIIFEEGATSMFGRPLENYVRVMVHRNDSKKVNQLAGHFLASPENWLFSHTIGVPNISQVKDLLNGKNYPPGIPPSWAQENQLLIRRSVKAGWLKAAKMVEGTDPQNALIFRQEAEAIEEPALDPEGLRIVIRQKMEATLIQHPELKPELKPKPEYP